MKKILMSLLLPCVVFSAFGAELSRPFLWKAEKEGKTAYLLGTMHIGFGVADLPEELFPFVDSSSRLFIEADLSSIDQSAMEQRMYYQGGESLDQFLSPAAWETLVKEIAVVPADTLKKMTPGAISQGIVLPWAVSQLQLTGRMDFELVEYANSRSLSMGYLEDAEVQLGLFDLFTPELLEEELNSGIPLLEEATTRLRNLYDCYRASDLGCIENITQEAFDESESLAISTKERNQSWIPVIESALATEEQIFVAAGVAHFVLEGSVLEFLKRQGYTVEAVEVVKN